MKLIILICFIAFSCTPKESVEVKNETATVAVVNQFGAEPSLEGEPVTLTKAIDGNLVDKAIKVSSRVTNVCKKKGCWITLTEGETEVRVTFKDYGFFVPLDFKDVDVVLEGVLSRKLIPEADRKHFAEDQGASKEELAKIKGDEYEFTFEATTVTKV